MKKYKYLFFLMFLFTMTSCLKGNLDDLPEFEDNEITGVQRVMYRYVSNEISGSSGLPLVKDVSLGQEASVNKKANHVGIKVTVPAANESTFPAAQREKCNKSNLLVMISISTAARVTPVGNAPKLGVPGDWSGANKYIVTAANGSEKEWIIEITEFKK